MQQHRLIVRSLGIQPYQEVVTAMKHMTDRRNKLTSDEIWLLQHPALFTQGQTGLAEHILVNSEIPIIQSDRGGQVTYHAPGQQIIYVMIDLRRKALTVRQFVHCLEQLIIDTLADLTITGAYAKKEAPGVYLNQQKIASLGLRIRHGCTFHGIALNVNMDLTPFSYINPCGYKNLSMTQLSHYVKDITCEQVQPRLLAKIQQYLHYPQISMKNWRKADYD